MLAHWDRYGTQTDAVAYQKNIADFIKKARGLTIDGDQSPRVGIATPGFDNRGCAGWGFDFSHLPRGKGELYSAMWEYNLKNARQMDWVFLPTWNDWTENSRSSRPSKTKASFCASRKTTPRNSKASNPIRRSSNSPCDCSNSASTHKPSNTGTHSAAATRCSIKSRSP